jgi:acetoin utilization deacetylase AcuC-like enzyme
MVPVIPRSLRRAWSRLRGRGVPLVYSARYQQIPWDTPIDPLRGEKVLSALDEAGLLPAGAVSEPRPASLENVLRVHTADYLRALQSPDRLGSILGAQVVARDVERILDLQRLMVGGTIQATRLALRSSRPAVHLGGGFHHARADAGMGFCVFNDVAIAIARLRARGFAAPILVVDLDLHDGNGTRSVFAADRSVHTFSIHNQHWSSTEAVASTALALGGGVDDALFLRTLEEALPPVFAEVRPGLVFYVAGVDGASDDALGDWRLTGEGIAARDRFVTDLARPAPLVVLLAGGYGRRAWSYSARYLLWLGTGQRREPPEDEELTLIRLRRRSVELEAARGSADLPFTLSEDDIGLVRPAWSHWREFLGVFSRQDVELQLETLGLLAQMRARGFRRLRVELGQADDTLRVVCEDRSSDELLLEMRASRSRSAAPGFDVIRIEWLLLQNPREAFSERRPRLPGQSHPGLGMLKDVLGWLVLVCEQYQIDGLLFVAAHYHIAVQSRRLVRLLSPRVEGRMRSLVAALAGLSLAEATAAVAEGRVVDADGEPFVWEPVTCVVPVSAALLEQVTGEDYEEAASATAAELGFRVGAPGSGPPRS